MQAGPVESGATIVTSVALAAARTAVKQQVQYNETIQKSAERKVEDAKAAKAKDSKAGANGADGVDKAAKKPESQGGPSGVAQVGLAGVAPQSANPSRGSQVDLRV